jgi:hypothetical protein
LLNSVAVFITKAKIILRFGKPLFRCFSEPYYGFCFVFPYAITIKITMTQLILCINITLFCKLLEQGNRI